MSNLTEQLDKLEKTAKLAEELSYWIRELKELMAKDDRDQLNCGLHRKTIPVLDVK